MHDRSEARVQEGLSSTLEYLLADLKFSSRAEVSAVSWHLMQHHVIIKLISYLEWITVAIKWRVM